MDSVNLVEAVCVKILFNELLEGFSEAHAKIFSFIAANERRIVSVEKICVNCALSEAEALKALNELESIGLVNSRGCFYFMDNALESLELLVSLAEAEKGKMPKEKPVLLEESLQLAAR
ncbi:MAG: hypothetical protein V1494_05910 [Candidatus Diapherotrites archaeon]